MDHVICNTFQTSNFGAQHDKCFVTHFRCLRRLCPCTHKVAFVNPDIKAVSKIPWLSVELLSNTNYTHLLLPKSC